MTGTNRIRLPIKPKHETYPLESKISVRIDGRSTVEPSLVNEPDPCSDIPLLTANAFRLNTKEDVKDRHELISSQGAAGSRNCVFDNLLAVAKQQ